MRFANKYLLVHIPQDYLNFEKQKQIFLQKINFVEKKGI